MPHYWYRLCILWISALRQPALFLLASRYASGFAAGPTLLLRNHFLGDDNEQSEQRPPNLRQGARQPVLPLPSQHRNNAGANLHFLAAQHQTQQHLSILYLCALYCKPILFL